MKKGFYFLIALLGCPLVTALACCVWGLLFKEVPTHGLLSAAQWGFLGGFVLMFAVYFKFGNGNISYAYIFAHEMTHAIAGLLCGAKIHGASVKKTGGFVLLSKSNLFITLAPYFVPLYALCALLIRFLFCLFWPNLVPVWVWTGILGFTFAFHFVYTLTALLTVAQPDIREYGRFFSYWLILGLNLLLIDLALTLFYGGDPFASLTDLGHTVALHYRFVYYWLILPPIHWLQGLRA